MLPIPILRHLVIAETRSNVKLDKYDQPIIFAITITLIVVGMISVWSWAFVALGWTGPLSVLKGGYVDNRGKGVVT